MSDLTNLVERSRVMRGRSTSQCETLASHYESDTTVTYSEGAMHEFDDVDDGDPREYLASAICYVADCEQATFRAWRRRNGLFPETKVAGGWNRFSLADMAVATLVSRLTSSGYGAQFAVNVAMKLLPIVEHEYTRRDGSSRSMGEQRYIVARIDAKQRITFSRYDAEVALEALFAAEKPSHSVLLISLDELMSLPRLDQVRPDEVDRRFVRASAIPKRKKKATKRGAKK